MLELLHKEDNFGTAKEDLLMYDPRYWYKAFFKTDVKCDVCHNNLCETFNGTLVKARPKPIITMLEDIRVEIMTRIAEKRKFVSRWAGNHGPLLINGENEWPKSGLEEMQPPQIRRMPSRPKRNRAPEHDKPKNRCKISRKGMTMTCHLCKKSGHSKVGCPEKSKFVGSSSSVTQESVVMPQEIAAPPGTPSETLIDEGARGRTSNADKRKRKRKKK
ncbi:hypothetical protein DITRI_Ditri01bG0170800 [Diplodiscus trichospermus]